MLALARGAGAQSETGVRGRVSTESDRFALAGAHVTLRADDSSDAMMATTDEMGGFVFRDLRPATYTLTAEHDGFAPKTVRFVLKPRELKAVEVALAIRQLEEHVEVSAPITLASTFSPSSTVVTSALLEALPTAQLTSLPDAIVTAAPGMIRGHDDFVHVRGQELALNPVINGVSFWENAHAVFSGGVSPQVIDTANVMTGGFPAEYGNRFGGVVDIVTKSGLSLDHHGALNASFGQSNRNEGSGDFGGRSTGIGYYAFGSLFESDRFLSPPDQVAINDHGDGKRGLFQLDATPRPTDSIRVTMMADMTDFGIPVTPTDEALRPSSKTHQATRQQTAIVGWNRSFSSDALLHTSFYERGSQAHLFPVEGPLSAIAENDRRLFTAGVKSDFTLSRADHTIKVGAEAVRLRPDERLSYDPAGFPDLAALIDVPIVEVEPVAFSKRTWGGELSGYLQDAIKVGALSADVGMRVDRYGLVIHETHASPRVNVAYGLGTTGAVMHASYNHFFVPPPIENILSASAGLTRDIQEIAVALPALPATVENQAELGITRPIHGGTQIGVTGYYRRGRNEVHTTIWPDARIYSYASFDRASAYGLETKLDTRLRDVGLTAFLNYALGRVYFQGPVTGGFITEPHHITDPARFLAPMDQTHTLTGGFRYQPPHRPFWGSFGVEYGSGTPTESNDEDASAGVPVRDTATARVPGHLTANITAGADIWRSTLGRRISVRLTVENITNNRYKIAQESVFTPGQYAIPRLVSAGLAVQF
jgi:hypothetical protein